MNVQDVKGGGKSVWGFIMDEAAEAGFSPSASAFLSLSFNIYSFTSH